MFKSYVTNSITSKLCRNINLSLLHAQEFLTLVPATINSLNESGKVMHFFASHFLQQKQLKIQLIKIVKRVQQILLKQNTLIYNLTKPKTFFRNW